MLLKKVVWLGFLGFILNGGIALGEEKPDWKGWFNNLLQGLQTKSIDRYTQPGQVTAVAATRGDEQKASQPQKPYWKNSRAARREAKLKKEKEEFKAAVEFILDGKMDAGKKGLEEFKKNHPKSRMLRDVEQALERVKQIQTTPVDENCRPDSDPSCGKENTPKPVEKLTPR
ncbi:MAG: hypothetical protein HY400_06560 [Elusimicrobia bacterium]|nr:hypothetical protein [Elusimicrobiota bacterium]